MRRPLSLLLCLAFLAFLACRPEPAREATDAGCPAGEKPGPLGTCVKERAPCDSCASDADCPDRGLCREDAEGCRFCVVEQDGGGFCSNDECRSASECCGGAMCRTEHDEQLCGMCRVVEDECAGDDDCAGDVCVEQPTPACACSPGTFKACAKRCASDEDCGGGFRCLASGACEAIRCDAGFSCEPFEDCRPDEGDAHGCVRRACALDADCTGGTCVDGRCARSKGTCTLPPP